VAPKLSTLVADCLFVFDTNALLAPFGFGGKELNAIATVYRELAKNTRLFAAEWTILEFGRHRTQKLLSAHQTIEHTLSVTKLLEPFRCPMLEGHDEYTQIQDVVREINKRTDDYRNFLKKLRSAIEDWSWNDNVSELYREVFTAQHIINCPLSDADILKDTNDRNIHNMPPGYKDKSKQSNSVGDVVIWHSLIGLAKTRKANVVFVSNEEKHDWVEKADKTIILPRAELLCEFFKETNKHFGFISWIHFLELMVKDEEVIKQAKRINLDLSHEYQVVQKRVAHVLETLATIVRQFVSSSRNDEYCLIEDARAKPLIGEFYVLRGQYDELIYSPKGSEMLASIEVYLEEIESYNERLEYMRARMKDDGTEEEAALRASCQAFLVLFDRYTQWYLAGSP
jgi:hypothetical protein